MKGPGPLYEKNLEILRRLSSSDPWNRQNAKDGLPREDGRSPGLIIEITTESKPKANDHEAWLQATCPRVCECLSSLIREGLIERGFDWKISKVSLACPFRWVRVQRMARPLCAFSRSGPKRSRKAASSSR